MASFSFALCVLQLRMAKGGHGSEIATQFFHSQVIPIVQLSFHRPECPREGPRKIAPRFRGDDDVAVNKLTVK